MNFAKSLVGIILDKSADISDREDALTDLSDYTDDFVIDALIKLILDEEEDRDLRTDASETLILAWIKLNKFNLETFKNIPLIYQRYICKVLQNDRPEWIPIFENAVRKKLI